MFRRWWLSALLVVSLGSVLLAREGIVRTSDGRALEGDIDEHTGEDGVTVDITVRGATISIPRSSIDSIDYVDSTEDAFEDRLSKLAPNDVKGRLDLAKFELEHQQYEFARRAALSVQRADPQNEDAVLLLDLIQSQQVLLTRQANPAIAHPAPPVAPIIAAPTERLLTANDINRLRQYELRSDDSVRIVFLHDVRKRYLALPGADADSFNALTPVGQAMAIFQVHDPDLNADVRIHGDPRAFSEFHKHLFPRLLIGCAASGCHGGEQGGGLYLYTNVKEASWYTDFYILQSYSKKMSVSDVLGQGDVDRPMIDRVHPESSLLVQFGLPQPMADIPHPRVKDWKPIYKNRDDPAYIATVDWIGTMLKPFQPAEYGIDFKSPSSSEFVTGKPSRPDLVPLLPPPARPLPPPVVLPPVDQTLDQTAPQSIPPPALQQILPVPAPVPESAPATQPTTQMAPINKG